ncbi:MAG: hypothetical protein HYW22_00550 [Candidatus Aenigmarchaeota archaeon]|nr:hypothetical protein [Candidatus Aenigmarchaeota archaeon]
MNLGVYDVKVLHIPFFPTALAPYLKSRFYRTFNHVPQDNTGRVTWARRMEKASAVIMEDLESKDDNVFYGIHGFWKEQVNSWIETTKERFVQELQKEKIVTVAGIFVFVDNDGTEYPNMIELGTGQCILVGDGRVIAYVGGNLKTPGYDWHFRDRTNYERNFVEQLVNRTLVQRDYSSARNFAQTEIDRLLSGDVPRKDLVCGIKRMSKEWHQYSAPALGREQVKFAQKYEKKKGERAIRGYVIRDGRAVDIDETEFVGGTDIVALDYYRQKDFGRDGTSGVIGQVMHPIFGDEVKDWFEKYKTVRHRRVKTDENQMELSFG